ncbi:hypothetical protein ASG05_05945 [Frigoribacterium sp. Leaf186]|nr:hypothetical protein ASG05_05945 [Frigoribacterium sp. Leaf186]
MPQTTAMSGTAMTAPTTPPRIVPAVSATRMTRPCNCSVRPMSTGCSRLPSSWFTTTTTATTARAVPGPLATSATRAARMPAAVAPTSGMNAVRNTTTASGSARGTPRAKRPMPMPTASTAATVAVPRT